MADLHSTSSSDSQPAAGWRHSNGRAAGAPPAGL